MSIVIFEFYDTFIDFKDIKWYYRGIEGGENMLMSDRIKEKRLANNLTQEELATKLGLQKSAIAKYETGRVTNIKRSVIQRMSEIFDCSPAWLMGLDDTATEEQIEITIGTIEDFNRWKKIKRLNKRDLAVLDSLLDSLCKEDLT